MGASLSTDSTSQNPSPQNLSPPTPTMSSISPNSENPDPKTLENQNPDPKTLDNQNPDPIPPKDQNPEIANQPTEPVEEGQDKKNGEGEGEEEEEEGECGFCLFMKGGGCKDAFINWEDCVKEAEDKSEDIAEKCFEVTGHLKKCMEAHAEYYAPILRAEEVANEEVKQELEREAKKIDEANAATKVVEEKVEIAVEKQG